jgi:peptidyl-prolyl cis-trans isomerase SurA
MGRRPSIFLWIMLAAAAVSAAASAQVLDRIVANVNGDIITLSEVNERLGPLVKASGLTAPKDIDGARRKILMALVDQKLAEQEAERLEITVEEDEVQAAIAQIKASNKITDQEFASKILQQGSTLATFRKDLKAEILRSKLVQKVVRSSVVVADVEVENHLRRYGPGAAGPQPSGPAPQQVRVRNILILIPENANEGAVRGIMARLGKLKKDIEGGEDFAKVAATNSEAPNAVQGGDLGTISWPDMSPPVQAALRGLRPGQVSEPVVVGNVVQIFQLLQAIGSKDSGPAQTPEGPPVQVSDQERERVRRMILEQRLKEKFDEWIGGLRSNAVIEIKL